MALGTRTPWKWRAVDSGRSFVQHHPDLVADVDLDGRGGDDAVVGPGLDDLAGLDLPVDDLRRQIELLGAVGQDRRRQILAAVALGLGRELAWRRPPSPRPSRPRPWSSSARSRSPIRRRRTRRADVEHPRHPARGVAGDRADHLVSALRQDAQVQAWPSRRAGCRRSPCPSDGNERLWTCEPVFVISMHDRTGRHLRHGRLDLEIGQVELHHRASLAAAAPPPAGVVPLESSSRTTKSAAKARSSAPTATTTAISETVVRLESSMASSLPTAARPGRALGRPGRWTLVPNAPGQRRTWPRAARCAGR